jgi:outer membrane protein assembly factor BamB
MRSLFETHHRAGTWMLCGALLLVGEVGLARADELEEGAWTGPLTTQWEHDVGRSIVHPIQLYGDDLLVTTTDRRVVSFDLVSGERNWRRRFKEDIPVAPTILGAGEGQRRVVLYHGRSDGGHLRSLNGEDGQDLWEIPWRTRPVHISGEGDRIWLLEQRGRLIALSALDGKELWEEDGNGWGSPAFVDDGETLFVLERSDSLHAYRGDSGERLWSRRLPGQFSAPPALLDDALHVVSTTGTLWRIDPRDGRIVSTGQRAPYQLTAPVSSEDRIVTAASSGIVEARDSSGEGWSYASGHALESVAVPAGPVILLGTSDGELLALRSDRGELAWSLHLDARFKVAPLVTDRYLVLATHTGEIYVYHHGS